MVTLRKSVLVSLMALLMMAASFNVASSTETRVGSMGGIGLYTHDNSNIFFFPGAIFTYSGQVVGELRSKGNDNDYSIGIHYPYGSYSVIGVYLNRPISLSIPSGIVNTVDLNQTTDIFYGTQLTNYDLGLKLSVGLDNAKQDVGADEDKESAFLFGLGGGLSNETMDLGLDLRFPSAKRDSAGTEWKWSGFGIGFNGRMFHGETTKLVPLVVFGYTSTSAETDTVPPATPPAKVDYRNFNLGIGVGINHQMNENNLLVMGLEVLGYNSFKTDIDGGDETTVTTVTMPGLYMGVESKVKNWLTGRLGAAQVYQGTKTKVNPQVGNDVESSSRSSQFNVSFGLGFTFGDFLIDAAINEGLFFDGPNFISGGVNPMANRLSVTYNF